MGAGELKYRMQFSRRVELQDGYGNTTADWQPEFEASCSLRLRKGSETVLASRLEGRSLVLMKVRRSNSTLRITPEWRATNLKNGVVFQIKEPPWPTDDNAYLEMHAESGVAA